MKMQKLKIGCGIALLAGVLFSFPAEAFRPLCPIAATFDVPLTAEELINLGYLKDRQHIVKDVASLLDGTCRVSGCNGEPKMDFSDFLKCGTDALEKIEIPEGTETAAEIETEEPTRVAVASGTTAVVSTAESEVESATDGAGGATTLTLGEQRITALGECAPKTQSCLSANKEAMETMSDEEVMTFFTTCLEKASEAAVTETVLTQADWTPVVPAKIKAALSAKTPKLSSVMAAIQATFYVADGTDTNTQVNVRSDLDTARKEMALMVYSNALAVGDAALTRSTKLDDEINLIKEQIDEQDAILWVIRWTAALAAQNMQKQNEIAGLNAQMLTVDAMLRMMDTDYYKTIQ